VKKGSNILLEVHIKDFQFDITSDAYYAVICNDSVIEVESRIEGDDFRVVTIILPDSKTVTSPFKIAFIQGNSTLGLSPLITLE
jgi:hypothetical protein